MLREKWIHSCISKEEKLEISYVSIHFKKLVVLPNSRKGMINIRTDINETEYNQ